MATYHVVPHQRRRHSLRRGSTFMMMMVFISILLLCASASVHAQVNNNNNTSTSDDGLHLNTPEIRIENSDFPWFTAIFHVTEAAGASFICGGAFIGSKYVLTARHCILDYNPRTDLIVDVGYLCPFKLNCGRPNHQSKIDKVHIDYGGGDLAMLVLEDPVPQHLGIRRVIPYLGHDRHPEQKVLRRGDNLTLVGAGLDEEGGLSDRVERLTVEYIPSHKCSKVLDNSDGLLDEFDFCSNAVVGNACHGDSGSALIIPGQGEYLGEDLMVAVHKFGPRNCADPGKRLFGHFPVSAASELVRDVACHGDEREDWCVYPVFAAPGEAPWFTEIRREHDRLFLRCNGVLIGKRYVVTAPGCLADDGSAVVAVVGFYCTCEGDNYGQRQESIPVVETHRLDEPAGVFALLVLSRAVTINVEPAVPYLGPSVHPKQRELKKGLTMKFYGSAVFASLNGLMLTLVVTELDMTIMKQKTCRKSFSGGLVIKDTLCYVPKRIFPCFDVGAPLIVKGRGALKGRDVVVGIHVLEEGPCRSTTKGRPLGGFPVSKAADLIQSVVCDGPYPEDWCPI